MTQSEGIGESAYNSGWIGSRFHKSVQIMMMRSKIASKITAAKFYSMSLESFSTVSQLKLDQILEIETLFNYVIKGRRRDVFFVPILYAFF